MPDRDEEPEEPAEPVDPEGDPAEEPDPEDVGEPEAEDDAAEEPDDIGDPDTSAETDEGPGADDPSAEVDDEDEDATSDETEPEPDPERSDEPAAEEPAPEEPVSDESEPDDSAPDDSAPDETEPVDEPVSEPEEGREPGPEDEAEQGHDDGAEGRDGEPATVSRTDAARRRVSRAFTRPRRTQVMVAVLLGVLGFAAVTQVRVNDPEGNYSALRQQELIDVLDGLAGARQRAQTEIEQLEEARDDLLDDSSQRRAALEQAQSDVENLNILAGLVPVTGPGIRVTVTEQTGAVQLDSMLDVIQELRTADAEAIQLNGEVRVVADTSFEQTTGGFLVDGQLLEPPYLIEAIGEPAVLAEAMDIQVGAGAGLRDDGAEVRIEELNSLDITSVHEPEDPQYAVPEEDQ